MNGREPNLFQANAPVHPKVVNNAGFELRNYQAYLYAILEFLKEQTPVIHVRREIYEPEDDQDETENEQEAKGEKGDLRYYLDEDAYPNSREADKIRNLVFNENTRYVFDQNDMFYFRDRIHFIDRDDDEGWFTLERDVVADNFYLEPNTYQIEKQIEAIENLQFRPLPGHAPLLQLFGWQDTSFSGHRYQEGIVEEWYVLTDLSFDGTLEQRRWVEKALQTPDFALLEGPPGSGKTTSIIELVLQLVKRGKRVLLSSATHVAVDNVIGRMVGKFSKQCLELIVPVRICSDPGLIHEDNVKPYRLQKLIRTYKRKIKAVLKDSAIHASQQYLKDNLDTENEKDSDRFLSRIILDAANLVGGTTIGILQHPDFKRQIYGQEFDYLIIDEVKLPPLGGHEIKGENK